MRRPTWDPARFAEVANRVLPLYFFDASCINGTRVVLEVARRLGVGGAYPLSVSALATNAAHLACATEAGKPWPETIEEAEAWKARGSHSLIVGVGKARPDPEMWDGHLVAIVRGVLVDSSARQMHRPASNIFVPDRVIFGEVSNGFLRGDLEGELALAEGGTLIYRAKPYDRTFETAPGFRLHNGNLEAVDEIVAAMRRRSSASGPG